MWDRDWGSFFISTRISDDIALFNKKCIYSQCAMVVNLPKMKWPYVCGFVSGICIYFKYLFLSPWFNKSWYLEMFVFSFSSASRSSFILESYDFQVNFKINLYISVAEILQEFCLWFPWIYRSMWKDLISLQC